MNKLKKWGPRTEDAPADERPCPACGEPFRVGDFTTLIPLGPGDDEESRERCREGRVYNAVAVQVHWACATGEDTLFEELCNQCNGSGEGLHDGSVCSTCKGSGIRMVMP